MQDTNTPLALLAAAMAVPLALVAAQPAAAADGAGPSLHELNAPMANVRAARFHLLDLNGDGYMSRDEIPAGDAVLRSQFPSLDRNHDGRLDLAEYVGPGR
jgi:hypothetical protein